MCRVVGLSAGINEELALYFFQIVKATAKTEDILIEASALCMHVSV